jgi:hypothetical protein
MYNRGTFFRLNPAYNFALRNSCVMLKVHKHEIFLLLFLQKPKPYGPKGLIHEIFENRIPFGIRLLNISAHAQHAMKSVPSMLSMR